MFGDRDCSDLDERVFRIVTKADPNTTPAFCGYEFNPDGLSRLANDALANASARPLLGKLLERQILLAAAQATGVAGLRAIHESWRTQIDTYKAHADAVVRAGAARAVIDEDRDQTSAALLLSVLPNGQSFISDLRRKLLGTVGPELNECNWFRELGKPSTGMEAS